MTHLSQATRRARELVILTGSVGVLSALLCRTAIAAEPAAPAVSGAATVKENTIEPSALRPTAEQRETWRQSILKTPKPGKGCYSADYPETQWREVPCEKPSNKLYPPRRAGGP